MIKILRLQSILVSRRRRLRLFTTPRLSSSTISAQTPTVSPSVSAAQSPPTISPKGLGTRFLDYISEHPWHFFGPLIGAIVLYFVRLNLNSQEQDALIRTIDKTSPLHAREVAAIGRMNSLTLKEWDGVLQAVTDALIEKKGGGMSLRPSEMKILIERVIKRPLRLSHMLERASTAIKADNQVGVTDFPVNVVDLLLLYGSVLGGRPEPPELAPPAKDAPLPPPSSPPTRVRSWPLGTLNPWVSVSDFEDHPTPSLRMATYIRMLRGFANFEQQQQESSNSNSMQSNIGLDISDELINVDELSVLFDKLGVAHQIPSKSRTGPHTFYPWFKYSIRPGNDALDEAAKEMKIELYTSPEIKERKKLLTLEESKKIFLKSRSICSWNECN